MTAATAGAARRIEKLTERFAERRGVTQGTGFGSSVGLRVRGKIFAFVSRNEELVVKLPRDRVDELVAAGKGARFDPGHGRIMKEWLELSSTSQRDWNRLADEAFLFVGKARSAR
jgi:hypothetical protein